MPTILGDALNASDAGLDTTEGNLIRDVWYGRRSLVETYWKWGFVGGLLTIVAGALFGILAGVMQSKVPILLYLVLSIPYQVWITVGLWRSAREHGGFWGGLVRVLVVLSVIGTPFQIGQALQDLSNI